MANFNLLLHGMMLMNELNDTEIDIQIPAIPDHRFRFGDPLEQSPDCKASLLEDLPKGDLKLSLSGYRASSYQLRDRVSAHDELLMKKSAAKSVGKGRTTILVPKPERVRCARNAEVDPSVIGTTAPATFVGLPSTLSEIAIFRYTVLVRTTVELKTTSGAIVWTGTVPDDVSGVPGSLNLCVYAQCLNKCNHNSDALNSLIDVGGRPCDLKLHAIGNADGPFDTPYGVLACHMKSLKELQFADNRTNPGGCGRGWLINA